MTEDKLAEKDEPLISVVIPARNEEDEIGKVVAGARAAIEPHEIIVVDDGSSDATSERATEAGAKVIRNPYNIGNGASVRRGGLSTTGDIVVLLDGDGQHPPAEIPKLLESVGEFDMVVGARTSLSDTSRLRNFGNFMLIGVAKWVSGQDIKDLTCGFRAIKRDRLVEFVHLFPRGYSYPTTITLALMLSGRFVKYVPLDSIGKRKSGVSDISPASDFLRFIAIIVRIIVMFSPQRFFAPIGGILFLLGLVVSGLQFWFTGGIQSAGLALLLSSIYILCFGVIADQLALLRRRTGS